MPTAAEPFRVVIAPDKFKGSLTADEVVDILARSLTTAVPGIEIVSRPIADGGEGTVDTVLTLGYPAVHATVHGPLGAPVLARYAMREHTAVIEMAAAAGLALLPGAPDPDTAAAADTFGVGELVVDALDRGATRIVLGIGGSASTDGGQGLVRALGARLRTSCGTDPRPGGAGLRDVEAVDVSGLDPRLAGVDLVVACDVDNPLVGPHGAAAVYGPQKGADPAVVRDLNTALGTWADVVATATGHDRRAEAGLGAGGGTAFGAVAVLGGRLTSGIDVIADLTDFDTDLRRTDLLIVGEGSLDAQSLRGKGPIGLAGRALRAGVRAVAVVGRNELASGETQLAGLSRVYALTDLEPRPEVCMSDARRLLAELGDHLAQDVLSGRTADPAPGADPDS